jgi:rRNA maturation endonuclease Nob1
MYCASCGWAGLNTTEVEFCPSCGDDTKLRQINEEDEGDFGDEDANNVFELDY